MQQQDLVPRWKLSLNMSRDDMLRHFVFVPRLPHEEYLMLLSFLSVFLNTFPFGDYFVLLLPTNAYLLCVCVYSCLCLHVIFVWKGSGITSSDALSLCIPVVVLPAQTSFLHFAAAQVIAMFPEQMHKDRFIAPDVDSFAKLAANFASASLSSKMDTRKLICDRKHLLFGEDSLLKSVHEWRSLLLKLSQQ